MARQEQFVKIYTKLLDDEWFLSLRGLQRGIFLQLIVLAKKTSDTGVIRTRSIQHLANVCAVNRRSVDSLLAKMQADCKATVNRALNGVSTITLLNYPKYQEVKGNLNNIRPIIETETETRPDLNYIVDIISDLNAKTGKNFRATTPATRKAVNARLKAGYTFKDFQFVHNVKCAEWLKTDMQKYLTPSTLYRPGNFEKYRNQKPEEVKPSNRELIREVLGDDTD